MVLVTQRVYIRDRFTTSDQHRGHIHQHPAPVMTRDETAPHEGRRERLGQADPIGKKPHRDAARVGDHAARHQISPTRSTTKYASPTECLPAQEL